MREAGYLLAKMRGLKRVLKYKVFFFSFCFIIDVDGITKVSFWSNSSLAFLCFSSGILLYLEADMRL